jgi:hypothetical protein
MICPWVGSRLQQLLGPAEAVNDEGFASAWSEHLRIEIDSPPHVILDHEESLSASGRDLAHSLRKISGPISYGAQHCASAVPFVQPTSSVHDEAIQPAQEGIITGNATFGRIDRTGASPRLPISKW